MLSTNDNGTAPGVTAPKAGRTKRGARLSAFSIRHDITTGKHDLTNAIKVIERLAALGAMLSGGDHAESN